MQSIERPWSATILLVFILVLHVVISYTTQFTAWPEMLTYPWLIHQGFNFYKDVVQPYQPGLPYFLLAIYNIFGNSVQTLHAVTILFFLASDILIFKITQRRFTIKAALIVTLFFVLASIYFEGNGLWFDFAGLPLILLFFHRITLVSKKTSVYYHINSGLLLGLAILIKQTNLIFLLPTIFFLGISVNFLSVFFGTVLPLIMTALFYFFTKEFGFYFFWGWQYPLTILPKMPGFSLLPTLKQLIFVGVWCVSALVTSLKNKKIASWFFVSLIFTVPRFALFHLIPAVGFAALMLPLAFKRMNFRNYYLVATFMLIFVLFWQFLIRNTGKPIRFFEPETIAVRKELEMQLPANMPIYFYNVPSQYFVSTSLISIKPWIDLFPWYLEMPEEQSKIIAKLETTHYVVSGSFLNGGQFDLGAYRPTQIDVFINSHFHVINTLSNGYKILIANSRIL